MLLDNLSPRCNSESGNPYLAPQEQFLIYIFCLHYIRANFEVSAREVEQLWKDIIGCVLQLIELFPCSEIDVDYFPSTIEREEEFMFLIIIHLESTFGVRFPS